MSTSSETTPEGDGSAGAPRLERRLGLGLLTLDGVGVMIGAGVFVLIGAVAAEAGTWAPAAFAVAAASFAERSARNPEAGAAASYARVAYGSNGFSVFVGLAVSLVGLLSAGAVL